MEHLIFYFAACLTGMVCLVSILAVHSSNKRVLRDLKHPAEAKDKWMGNFIQEHQKLLKENTKIHNPSVYVIRRMRGRKIGPWSIRQVKAVSWGTFILSFLFMGIQFYSLQRAGIKNITFPVLNQTVSAVHLTIVTAIVMGIVLLSLKLLMGTGYQEDEMETDLLEYVENRWKEPAKIVPLENARTGGSKENKSAKKKEQKTAVSREKEKAVQQMEQGILEAAAADSRYKHLLNKEEEAIVKDVIKEFLT